MSKNSELKPILNKETGEFMLPGAMLKFLMTRAKVSREELFSRLNNKAPGSKDSKFIESRSQLSDFTNDAHARTIPYKYLAQLIRCFGMKKMEESYYITEFLRSYLPLGLSEYIKAYQPDSVVISKNIAIEKMKTELADLTREHNQCTEHLYQLNKDAAKWRLEAFKLANELDFSIRERDELSGIQRTATNKSFLSYLPNRDNLVAWECSADGPGWNYWDGEEKLVKEFEGIIKGERDRIEIDLLHDAKLSSGEPTAADDRELDNTREFDSYLASCSNEIIKNTSSQSIENMINSFFNCTRQSDALIRTWYDYAINGFLTENSENFLKESFLKLGSGFAADMGLKLDQSPVYGPEGPIGVRVNGGHLRPLHAILISIFKDWCSQLNAQETSSLLIEDSVFEEYCCTLFSNYKNDFPVLSYLISPFDIANPKATFNLLKSDYLSQKAQYEKVYGADLTFEDFTNYENPPCTLFGMPVYTLLSFAEFVNTTEGKVSGPRVMVNRKKQCMELNYLPSSFTLNYLYRIREHNYSSPDAAIHIANLMNCKFDIEQAKVISIRVLDELSEFRATEDYMMHLKRQCETYISPDNFLI